MGAEGYFLVIFLPYVSVNEDIGIHVLQNESGLSFYEARAGEGGIRRWKRADV